MSFFKRQKLPTFFGFSPLKYEDLLISLQPKDIQLMSHIHDINWIYLGF